MRWFLTFSFLAASVCLITGLKVRHDNYKVFTVFPETEFQIQVLRNMEDNLEGISFWSNVGNVGTPVHMMVAPHKLDVFKNFISATELKYEVYIDDVQKLITAEEIKNKDAKASFGWTNYYRLADIYSWLDSLAKNYSSVVTTIVGGHSYEDRQIKGVKVSYKKGNPVVYVEGGIHAREWISPATVTYILNELLTSKDKNVRDIAENYDWYIFPSVNPDGYEYTHTDNRLWRKNRRPITDKCVGVDLNRNYGYRWNTGGASSKPCDETFAGYKEFSEIETGSLSEHITSVRANMTVYLSFHSFSQLLLFPYGHTTEHLDNYEQQKSVGQKAINKLSERYGTKYTTGNTAEEIYIATGTSIDWVKATHKILLVYTYELRDTGRYGFLLPPEQIIPTAEETMDSVVVILQEARKLNL